jgi:hypothetical protein
MKASTIVESFVRGASLASVVAMGACAVDQGASEGEAASSAALSGGEVSLFGSTDHPAVVADSDSNAVELGVRFRSDVAGTVTGIRYYRSASNTGAHTAHLWSNGGTLLASATFATTTTTGWQTVRFARPVTVSAGRSYVASYHTDVGHYSADNGYFSGKGKDSGPLHAPADSSSSHNGVYHYGGTAFPTDSYRGSNYWVDVLLVPTSGGAVDAGAPPPSSDAGAPPTASPPPPPPPPSSGGFPGPNNTGVPAGTQLTPSGDITVTKDGTVLDALDVTGCIYIEASNVTIKRTMVHGGGCFEPIHVSSGTNLQVFDTEIDGERSPTCGESIGTSDYSITRVNAHGCSDGPRLAGTGPIVIQDSWIHDLSNLPGDHGDGIQAYGLNGGPVTIRHNTIVGGSNAAVFTADGATGDMIIDNNLMSAGGYTLRVYDNTVHVTNNLIVKNTYEYGPVAAFRDPGAADPGVTIVEWTNNHLCDNADGTGVSDLIPEP